MLDTSVTPIHADSPFCTGLCVGTPMDDLTGIPLKPEIIKAHLLAVMEAGKTYPRDQLKQLVEERHARCSGSPSAAVSPLDQFKKSLAIVKEHGEIDNPSTGYWRRMSDGPVELPVEQELEAEVAENAEVAIGRGNESVYGWYLPAYRRLAESEGKKRFPIKVGMTTRDAQQRMEKTLGMVPERPVLGFVLKVDDASQWERLIHSKLSLRGRRIEGAIGNEWFDVSLNELRDLASAEMAELVTNEQQSDGKANLAVVTGSDQ